MARASFARCGATASRERRNAAACHDHGARIAGPSSGSSGSSAAASRPSAQAVPWYAMPSRSWLNRGGGWPRTSRMRGRARLVRESLRALRAS